MWDNIGKLLAFSVLALIIGLPGMLASYSVPKVGASIFAYYLSLPMLGAMLYSIFVSNPVWYGYAYSLIKATRDQPIDVSDLFEAFKDYGNVILGIVLSMLVTLTFFSPLFLFSFFLSSADPAALTSLIVDSDLSVLPLIIALFLLIMGIGLLIYVKISFIPYLIMDQKMPALEALSTSWSMTRGHTLTLLGLAVTSMFIIFVGMLCFIVGAIPASIWTMTAYASMYNAIFVSDIPEG